MSIMLMSLAIAAAASSDAAVGKWKTETRNAIVEIARCATITMVDANTLKLKGCIMAPLCSSQT